MKRNSKNSRFNEKSTSDKIIMYSVIGVSVLAVIVIALLIYSQSLNNSVKNSTINLGKINNTSDNTTKDSESTSTEIGKTVDEAKNEINNIENANTSSNASTNNKNNTVSTNSLSNNAANTSTAKTNGNLTSSKSLNTTTNQNEVKTENKKELTFEKPVEGEMVREFAKDNLIYSTTLDEWVTHMGVDIKAEKTTVVKSAENGTVKNIKNDPRYGLTIVIEHNDGFETVYSNLLTSEFVVEGEKVEKGQSIGTVGNTAVFEISDEPHLHFEILKDSVQVDPTIYLK